MFQADTIQSKLFGEVGWKSSTLSNIPALESDNASSISGLYFQDNSFVNIENIYDCQHDPDISDANFNILLRQLQNDAILEVCNKVVQDESNFIESVNLYPYEKSFEDVIEPNTNFVGFRIEKNKRVCSLNKISWIELSFDSDVTFNIYLFNSNKKDPIKTQEVTASANESVIVNFNNYFIADSSTYKGGKYYFGYFEEDLSGAKALKKDYELANLYVNTKCMYVMPTTVQHTNNVLDISTYTNESDTFGLNIGIDSYIDYTELIIRNKNLFWQAIRYQMGEIVLHLIETSTRTNDSERLSKENINQIAFILYGRSEAGIEGIIGKLKRTIMDLKNTLFPKPLITRGTLG